MSKDTHVEYENNKFKQKTTSDDIELFSNAADSVSVNDAVFISGNGSAAKANASIELQCAIGIVFEIVDSTNCRVITSGLVSGFSTGMVAGTHYYLGVNPPGSLTTIKPGLPYTRQLIGVAYKRHRPLGCAFSGPTQPNSDNKL